MIDSIQNLPRTFWYLWTGTLLNRLGTFVLPFLSLYLVSERGLTAESAGFIVALYGVGAFTAHVSGGMLADGLGRRKTILISVVCTAVTVFALGVAREFNHIALLTMVMGFAADLYRPAMSAAVADVVPDEDRVRAFGLMYWAINLGAGLAPIVAAWMIARGNYFWLFAGDALTTLLFGIVIWRRVPETRPKLKDVEASATVPHGESKSFDARNGLWIALSDVRLVSLTVLTFLLGCLYMQAWTTLPLDITTRGITASEYGWLIAINGLLIVAISLPVAAQVARLPRASALALAGVLVGVGFALTAVANTLPVLALTIVIWTMGEIIAAPVAPAVIADLAPVHLRGRYQGVWGASWGAAHFAGPAAGGLVLSRYGSQALWMSCLGVGCMVACGHLLLTRKYEARRLK